MFVNISSLGLLGSVANVADICQHRSVTEPRLISLSTASVLFSSYDRHFTFGDTFADDGGGVEETECAEGGRREIAGK